DLPGRRDEGARDLTRRLPPGRLEVLVRKLGWRARQPAVDDCCPQCRLRDGLQLDEDGRVAVEVRDREERLRIRGEDRFLLAEVFNADCEDGPGRRRGIAEASDVCLAERPLPRERLPGDEPCAVAVTRALA